MPLELPPDVEKQVHAHAEAAGIPASDYIALLLETSPASPRLAPRLRVLPPDQARRQNEDSIAYLKAQLAAAEKATADEVSEAEAEWRAFQKAMNDLRRAHGERLLYKEDEPL